MKPEPFHADVTFDWTQPKSTWSKDSKSVIWISLDTVYAKRMSIYGGPAQVPNLESSRQVLWSLNRLSVIFQRLRYLIGR